MRVDLDRVMAEAQDDPWELTVRLRGADHAVRRFDWAALNRHLTTNTQNAGDGGPAGGASTVAELFHDPKPDVDGLTNDELTYLGLALATYLRARVQASCARLQRRIMSATAEGVDHVP
jgi:hypothetical protein